MPDKLTENERKLAKEVARLSQTDVKTTISEAQRIADEKKKTVAEVLALETFNLLKL